MINKLVRKKGGSESQAEEGSTVGDGQSSVADEPPAKAGKKSPGKNYL